MGELEDQAAAEPGQATEPGQGDGLQERLEAIERRLGELEGRAGDLEETLADSVPTPGLEELGELLEALASGELPDGEGLEGLLALFGLMAGFEQGGGDDFAVPEPFPAPPWPEGGLLGQAGAAVSVDAADAALAEGAALELADLPAGWQRDGFDDWELAGCLYGLVDLSDLTVTGASAVDLLEETGLFGDDVSGPSSAASDPPSGAGLTESGAAGLFSSRMAASRVAVLADESQASAVFEWLGDPLQECLPEAFAVPPGGDLAFTDAGFPAFGDESQSWRLRAELPEPFGLEMVADVVYFRDGRVWVLLVFAGIPDPFDPTLARELAETVAARAAGG